MNSASITLINNASRDRNKTAIIDNNGEYSSQELLNYFYNVATYILDGKKDLTEARVAFIVPSSFEYVATQWGIWRAGGMAVPFCVTHPDAELKYVIDGSQADMVVVHPQFAVI